jgi:hypothetical protein
MGKSMGFSTILSEFSGKPMEKPWISPAKKNRQLGH